MRRRVNTRPLAQCFLFFCISTQDFLQCLVRAHARVRIPHFFLAGAHRYAICNHWHCFASLSVVDGSDQSWLRFPLTTDHIIWLPVLSHNPLLRAQWQFLRGNAKHSNFLPTVASSPFFLPPCLSATVCVSRYLASFREVGKGSPKGTGRSRARATSSQNSSDNWTTPLP